MALPIPGKIKRAFLDVLPELLPIALLALPSSCRIIGSLSGPPNVVRLWIEGPDLPGDQLGIKCIEDTTRKQFQLVSEAIIKPQAGLVM